MPARRIALAIAVVLAGTLAFYVVRHRAASTPQILPAVASTSRVANRNHTADPRLTQSLAQLPLSFERRNWEKAQGEKFVSSGPGYALGITKEGATLVRRFHLGDEAASAISPEAAISGVGVTAISNVKISWLGANPASAPVGEEKQKGVSNYFPTSDRRTWRTHVARYGGVRIPNLYEGIDLRFHGDHQELEFDYIVAAGADPNAIRLGIGVPSIVGVTPEGDLEIMQGGDAIRLNKPTAYQLIRGTRHEVGVKYALADTHEVQFALGAYDHSAPLVIDPVLAFSAHFGASSNLNLLADVALDAAGNIYVAGRSCDVDYPVTAGAYQPTGGSITATLCDTGVITVLDPTASSLLYSTYLGPTGNVTSGIRILPVAGGALVAGVTTATDFPTTAGSYQPASNGGTCTYGPFLKNFPCSEGFLLEINSDGSQLIFSTYLGGSNATMVSGMTTDSTGNIYIVGATNSPDFPVSSGAADPSYGGGMCQSGLYPCFDGFAAKMSGDGSHLLLATYLGGNDDDFASGVAIDSTGNIYVGGTAYSTNFPTTPESYQPTHSSVPDQGDAFAVKLTPDMKTLTYSTYVGGTGFDIGLGLTIDSTGSAYIWGSTNSTDFPTSSGAFQKAYAGPAQTSCDPVLDSSLLNQPSCGDVFVTKLNPAGNALVYSTYIGGSAPDIAFRGVLDGSNNLWLLANVGSTDFPYSSDAYYQSTSDNIALMELSADGTKLPFATPLAQGNTGQSLALALTLDAAGDIYAAGQATSFLGTPGTFASGSGPAVFVAKYVLGTAHPIAAFSASTIDFSSETIPQGSSSSPQSVTLTNSGTGPMNLSVNLPTQVFGSPVPFSEYDNCGTTLAAGANCTINVVYQPTATSNSSGQITIIDNAPNAPHIVQLTGGNTGTIDSASFLPPTLTFLGQGPGTKSPAQLTGIATPASGQASLEPITTGAPVIGGPNASDFSIDTSSCVVNQHFCQLSVAFSPSASATGTRTASVSVATNAPDSPQTVTLSGTVSTGPYAVFTRPNFIPTNVGSTTSTSINITNSGGATLNATNLSISGPNAGEFSLQQETCGLPSFSLTVGQVCNVGIAFSPTAHGPRTATLSLTDNESIPASVTLSAFASDPTSSAFEIIETPEPINGAVLFPDSVVGTTGLTQALISILNEGQGTGSITSITLTGDYKQTNNCSASIPFEGSCTFTVLFSPTATGTRNGALTIVTNAPGPQTIVVNFTGNGVAVPQVNLAPPNLTFPAQPLNTPSSAQIVTLQNPGNGVLNISGAAVSGPFTQTNNCGAVLAAGASCMFNVVFTPTAGGPAGGLLSFKANAAGGYFTVGLSGTGASGAAPLLTPASLNFAAQAVGSVSPAQTVTLSNPGTASFAFTGLQATQNYQATSNCPASIAPGASCTVSVKFAPTQDTFTGGFPVNGAVYLAVGAKGSPLTIETNGTALPSNGAQTNLGLTSAPNPSTSGQVVTFTAMVTPVTTGPTPTGTLTFFDSAATIGTATLNAGTAMLKLSTLSVGNHSIFYSYSGDSNYAPETSSGVGQTVTASSNAPTSTDVTASPNPATVGQTVKFTAFVSSTTSGTITGTVQFYDGSTPLGSPVTLSGGSGSYSTSSLSQGTHTITATYSGNSSYAGSTSPNLSQQINAGGKASTSTAVKSSLNPSTVGASVTLTANVSSSTSGTITGTVTFFDGGTALGSAVALASGAATYTTTALTQGPHTITAAYSGDSNYTTSTSPALTQTVNAATKAATTTAVTSSLNPSPSGTSVTFTAAVTSATAGTITGTVTFFDGSAALGSPVTLTSGAALFSTSSLAAGSHTITAVYSGDSSYASSTSPTLIQTVNAASKAATTTTVTSSLNPSTAGASVMFTASVTSKTAGTITGSVSFFDGSTQIGPSVTLTSGTATYATTLLSQGTHSITAMYSGDSNYANSISTALTQTVNASTKSATSTMVTSSQNPSTSGANVSFTAAVTSSTAGTITGTVAFFDGGTQLGTPVTLSAGSASYSTTMLSQGSHSITAQYSGDTSYLASTSPALTQTVNASTTDFSVAVSPSQLSVTAGQNGRFMVSVAPIGGSTQTVTLSCSQLPANATCSFASNAVTLDGTHTATVAGMIVTTARSTMGPSQSPVEDRRPPAPPSAWQTIALAFAGSSALLMIRTSRDRAWRLALAMLLLMLPALAITACSSSPGSSGTPKGTYNVSVTGTSNATAHAASIALSVN
jgi:hypothetical protein